MVEQSQTGEFSLKAEHHKMMKEAGCNIEDIIELRHDLHKHPEGRLEEFETSKKIRERLLTFGIEPENIKACAVTGLVVDIIGTGEGLENSGVNTVALRADIDGLPIQEADKELPYRSVTNFAHMCGHDGHTCTLLAAAQVFASKREKIPKGKKVRLLFQPAEEGPGGALPMIKEGCLDGVDEIYGFHNIPNYTEGDVRVQAGAVMSQGSNVRIKVIGKGGHGSVPHMLNDVISAGAAIINNLHTIKSRGVDSKENFVFTICQFTSGFTYNVFPDEAFMQGTVRTFNAKVTDIVEQKIFQIAENTALAMGCKAEVEFQRTYPPVVNHAKETEHVIRVAKAAFGETKVSAQDLPIPGSEDFSYYLENKPGCFYFLCTNQPKRAYHLHSSTFDYNDSMIASGALLYVRLVEDRLGASIL